MPAPKKVRGKVLEIDAPSATERDYIFSALSDPGVYVPFGCKSVPARALFDQDMLEIWRGDAKRREPVRYHLLRRVVEQRPVGFFVDFGWDSPIDSTREIDLAFPDPAERDVASYLDATVIVAQYLFNNKLAKRLRWRVDAAKDGAPRRSERQGARLLFRQEERHPVTGEWVRKYIYEFALADFERLGKMAGVDPRLEYAQQRKTVWDTYRGAKR